MMFLITPDKQRASLIPRACDRELAFHHEESPTPDLAEVLHYIETNDVEVVLVGPELAPDVSEELTSAISNRFPFLGVIVFTGDDANSVRQAFRAGAADVASVQMSVEEIALVVENVHERMERRRAAGSADIQSADKQSHIVPVLSPRGGVGRTLVATSLAATLEQKVPGEVVLVDLDLQCGDVAPLLGLTPHLSIASLAGRTQELDSADVKAILAKDEEGLHVLAAPPSLTAAVGVTSELVTALLRVLKSSFRFVIIDTGAYMAETTLAAVDEATDIVLVSAPDVPSVRALGRMSDALDELRVVAPHRHLVINKATDRYGMPLRDIEAVSGMSATSQIPAAKELAMALNRGTPFHETIHPRGVVQKALAGLIKELNPTAEAKKRLLWRAR